MNQTPNNFLLGGSFFFLLSTTTTTTIHKNRRDSFFFLLLYYFSVSYISPLRREPKVQVYNSREGARLNGGSKAHTRRTFFSLSLFLILLKTGRRRLQLPLQHSLSRVCVTQLPAAESLSLYTHKTHACIHRRVNIIYIYIYPLDSLFSLRSHKEHTHTNIQSVI